MGSLYGIMGMPDVKNLTVNSIGQRVVYDAIRQLVDRYNAELAEMLSLLVERDTTDAQETYMLTGGGMMQEATDLTRPGAIRPPAGYPVGFEIRDARDQVAWDDIAMAYATVEIVEQTVAHVMVRHTNWVRYNLLKCLFRNTVKTYVDPLLGAISVQPLANGDTVVYPPVYGSTTGATDDHYVGIAGANIADGTNPIPVWRDELLEHVGTAGNVVMFLNPTQAAEAAALTAFVDIVDPAITVNQGITAQYNGSKVPGEVIGRVNNVWISSWKWMPANFSLTIDTTMPPPIIRRIDRVALPGRGALALVATQSEYPLQESFWRDRHGFGVGNRLNGVVGMLGNATYAIPTAYQ